MKLLTLLNILVFNYKQYLIILEIRTEKYKNDGDRFYFLFYVPLPSTLDPRPPISWNDFFSLRITAIQRIGFYFIFLIRTQVPTEKPSRTNGRTHGRATRTNERTDNTDEGTERNPFYIDITLHNSLIEVPWSKGFISNLFFVIEYIVYLCIQ